MSPEDQKKYGFQTPEAIEAQRDDVLEKELHTEFIQFLNRYDLKYYHAPMHKRSQFPVGQPDFGVHRASRILFIEFKVGKNRLDPDQKNRIAELLADDNEVHVCYSYEAAYRATTKFFNLE